MYWFTNDNNILRTLRPGSGAMHDGIGWKCRCVYLCNLLTLFPYLLLPEPCDSRTIVCLSYINIQSKSINIYTNVIYTRKNIAKIYLDSVVSWIKYEHITELAEQRYIRSGAKHGRCLLIYWERLMIYQTRHTCMCRVYGSIRNNIIYIGGHRGPSDEV